jgi:HEAT repeat protein
LELLDGQTEAEAALLARYVVEGELAVASTATDMIARLPSTEAIALLWTALACAKPEVQHYVVRRIHDIDATALRFNIRLALRGPGCEQRIAGLVALGELDDEPITPLVESLSDTNVDVRLTALRSLSRRPNDDAMEAIGRRLLDPIADVRGLAVAILGQEQNPSAASLLIDAAGDPDESVRTAAVEAIRSMASPEVIDRILQALGNPASEEVASNLLAELGEDATDALIRSISWAAPRTRDLIGEVLSRTKAAPTITKLLCDPEPQRRRVAAEAAVSMSGKRAMPQLLPLLVDPESDVRRRAVELIGGLEDATAIDELRVARTREPDPRVIDAIDASLRRMTRTEVFSELHSIDSGGSRS